MSIAELVPISKLKPLFTREIDRAGLDELIQSIRFSGIIEPLVVRMSDYGIIAGYRRYIAAKEIGLTEVPCVLVDCDDAEAFRLSLIENIQRENLSDYEVARRLEEFKERTGFTDEQMAQLIGKSRAWVTRHLKMLELERFNVPRGTLDRISERHARAILSQKSELIPTLLKEVEEAIKEKGEPPSVREIEKRAKALETEIAKEKVEGERPEELAPKKPAETAEEEIKRILSEAEEMAKAKAEEEWTIECPLCHRHILVKCTDGKHFVEE